MNQHAGLRFLEFNWIAIKTKVRSYLPLGDLISAPLPDSDYLELFIEAKLRMENSCLLGFPDLDKHTKLWIDELALLTQVSKKRSDLDWSHGYLLYEEISKYCSKFTDQEIYVFESGTARGFSSLVLAKSILDSKKKPFIVTIDILEHKKKRFWNSIGDSAGRRTREEILSSHKDLINHISFVKCRSNTLNLAKLPLVKIDFAFLDGAHTYSAVRAEFNFVSKFSHPGTVLVLDDVNSFKYPGVHKFVSELKLQGKHRVTPLNQIRGIVLVEFL